jgi:hypothetical protein
MLGNVVRALRSSAVIVCLGLLFFVSSFSTFPAFAQGRDRCHDYANQMVAQDQRARQMRCPNWTGHSNYQHHYNWCSRRPPASAQVALSAWGTRFQTCQFAAGGSPAARNDLQQCQAFTNFAMRAHAQYTQAGCPPRPYMHPNRDNHYNWCISKTPQQVAADRNLKQRGLNACLRGGRIP